MACTVSIAYTPSVTFGDSSPYTGEPLALKLWAITFRGGTLPQSRFAA